MKILSIFTLLVLTLFSCNQEQKQQILQESKVENGAWKFSFLTQKTEIPIRISIEDDSLFIHNSNEIISFSFEINNDSFFVAIPNYDSHIEGVIQSKTLLKGIYVKDYVDDYSIPFIAERTEENVFEIGNSSHSTIKSKYATTFVFDNQKTSPAIALFTQNGNNVVGSFAKETGDYRYLEGVIDGNMLKLSTFDGSHLYLFQAEIKGDSLINGSYISGKGGSYTWSAAYDINVELRDPEKLTYIEEGSGEFNFDLLDLNNSKIDLNDPLFNNKVKIIQIMGTWCPNCLDESRYFNSLYKKYKEDGLEIIAVAFENGSDTLNILEKLKTYKKNNAMEYTLLYGGEASSEAAAKTFPMLNKIMSFPTAIYLDRSNNVVKIYTGFYGPGTGDYYLEYTKSTEAFIKNLLQ
jgi:thiol-disulfide isomerase/thioredoxin/archaellum component FlaF (FlaF/FlaG flagellin family)